MSNLSTYCLFYFTICTFHTNAFIPHPLLADGGLTSITHADITELAFIRSLARFFYETRIVSNNRNGGSMKEQDYFNKEYTIDELYKLAHPEYNDAQVELYSYPLKFTLDLVMTHNALVDFDPDTRKLSAAHFDSEAFSNGSRRILQLRKKIVEDSRNPKKDLTDARQMIGKLLHTLQDFYSHSNWVEMGNIDINTLIGHSETIGQVAAPNQATCSDTGCTKKTQDCNLWQKITIRKCPLVYYDCSNNILSTINTQQILTSGYLFNQSTENNEIISKPANIGKCSHGSVMDESSHVPAIGGINKDSNSLIFSPHSNLHFQAVSFAINATERFLNDLRQEIGNDNFDRLFIVHPTEAIAQQVSDAVAQGQRFRFFSPYLKASLKKSNSFITDIKNSVKSAYNKVKSFFSNIFSKNKINIPTYDLSDLVANIKDTNNVRAGPYILADQSIGRKKRLINTLHQHR
ncbi:hypothetical protein I4U23_003430 [Adineta vaga]|uniref:VWA7 N-terminal domain-containing protein n=1 Tax=Adineta vaga TaxID=104782 RepID=D4NWF1_ADIVA|nr:hypothetical protein [Adineta vaga]UJR16530.1 hypothetical protein I4U23_003430 [Adineta vaga]